MHLTRILLLLALSVLGFFDVDAKKLLLSKRKADVNSHRLVLGARSAVPVNLIPQNLGSRLSHLQHHRIC
ncbi:hypothetical protein GE061_017419 [Apolygus lucorum]|uniref:Uncharacterized protein n=1 Tax=Apolygus lucorum TaxID=248454 RepID=A0A8S9XD16_APOLU|nr:hypothetical protein GE061_017419 [Apolygus lucorum]